MYYEDQSLPEIHYLKHRWDNDDKFISYEDKILNKTLSPYLFNNDIMNNFLNKLQKSISILFDNFNNYNVDKYYYKHKN